MTMTIGSTIKLNDGVEIPRLGLGVYESRAGKETERAVGWALQAGYRHVDTAKIYGNESSVGKAVRDAEVPREEVFITTKLWNSDHGYDKTVKACEASLKKLGLDWIDLYLVHWPVQGLRLETWRAMEALLDEGKCRAIGVSNYVIHHLEELLAHCKVVPAINQIELSPYNYLQREEIVAFCRSKGIVLEAYSPLTKGQKLDDPALVRVAESYSKTPAQILIRWALQHDFVVLPKSANENRIRENGDVFDFTLSEEDMESLDSLNENLVTSWDPTGAP